jgi:Flp pilus assembly protein TadD
MTDDTRLQTLQQMAEARPEDPRAHFGLALEYEKQERWDDVVRTLRRYLDLTADEGNAYGRLGHALRQLGRDDEAREAYRQGIDAAHRHNHPTMAMEFEETLEDF